MYAYASDDQGPADLGALVQAGRVTPRDVKCPSATSGRIHDYFYLPAGPDDPGQRMVACDYRGNHLEGRNVLLKSGVVTWMSEAEFQAALGSPINADFAQALRAAEGRDRPKRLRRPAGPGRRRPSGLL